MGGVGRRREGLDFFNSVADDLIAKHSNILQNVGMSLYDFLWH